MKALILAAGHGKRLGLEDRNKVMLELGDGRPLIAHIVDFLARNGMEPVIAVARSTFGEGVMEYFRNDRRVAFSVAEEPSGTAGDIYHAKRLLEKEKNFLVYFGDTLADVDLKGMADQHDREERLVTLCGVSRAIVPYGIISRSNDNVRIEEKPEFDFEKYDNYVNCPVFYAGGGIFSHMKDKNDFFGEVVPILPNEKVGLYIHRGFYYDIGTKKSYEEVRRHNVRL